MLLPEVSQLEVRGAEVVPPLRQGLTLVHREQRKARDRLLRLQPAISHGQLGASNVKNTSVMLETK